MYRFDHGCYLSSRAVTGLVIALISTLILMVTGGFCYHTVHASIFSSTQVMHVS